ncbi:MAG: S-layer homology domain-containing protein [Clostridia bacterium]|nr:S-layer homology domain-containing protein [Clostridia bacterium]
MKKIISLILSGMLMVSSVICAGAVSVDDFSDMPNDWSTPALTAAVENGLLTGSDGKILPADNLTRAQMATIISRAFGATSKASLADFTDVPSGMWYYEYMQKAVAMGVFTGDGSGLLTPENNITREQVFIVLSRAFKLEAGDESVLDKFNDKAEISSWARSFTAALVEKGYVNGSAGKINPKSNITRAEFAQIMYNMVKKYIDKPTTLTGTYRGNMVIRSSDVKVSANAQIDGIVVVGESCERVTIDNGAKMKGLVDNRPSAKPVEKPSEDKTDSTNKNNQTSDDIVWVVDTPFGGAGSGNTGSGNTGTGTPGVSEDGGYDSDEEGWSGIYRP